MHKNYYYVSNKKKVHKHGRFSTNPPSPLNYVQGRPGMGYILYLYQSFGRNGFIFCKVNKVN